jgi:hypothetical protein
LAEAGRSAKKEASPTGPRATPVMLRQEKTEPKARPGEAVEGHDEGPDGERGNVDKEEAEKGQPEAFGDDPVTELEEGYGLRVEHAEDLLPGVAGEEHHPHDLHAAARGPRARADGHEEEQDALREGAPTLPVRRDEARARAEARALEEAVEE